MRLIFVFVLLLSIASQSVFLSSQVLADNASDNMSTWRGNPARTGEVPGPGAFGKLRELWRFTGAGFMDSPGVANGVVFAPSLEGYMYAIDAASGDELWSFEAGFNVSPASVVDGLVYFGS